MAENCDPHSEMCGKSQRAPERKLLPFRCSACLWDLSNLCHETAHFLCGLLLHLPCGVGAAGDPASQENFNYISGESSHATVDESNNLCAGADIVGCKLTCSHTGSNALHSCPQDCIAVISVHSYILKVGAVAHVRRTGIPE